MTKHHVIYIPGFGDSRPWGQDKLIMLLRIWGIYTIYHPVGWNNHEAYQNKIAKLIKLVDRRTDEGKKVALVGVSAGASMAMNVFAQRKERIERVVFIAGKLLYPETIQEVYFQKNPAFRQSVFEADKNFKKLSSADRSKLLTMYAIADNTVPVKASKLPGVRHKRILAFGHIPTIYTALVFYGRSVAKFIKS